MDFSGLISTVEYYVTLLATQVLPALLAAIAILFMGNLAIRMIIRLSVVGARRSGVKPALIDLMKAAIRTVGYIMIIAGVLQVMGLNQIALALGGSISLVALGIATAASGNLGDIIAGVFLASDPDFGNGFKIKTGEVEGVIEAIDLRKTRIRSADGQLHVVPNKEIENKVWIVESRPGSASGPTFFPRRSRPRTGDQSAGSAPQRPLEPPV